MANQCTECGGIYRHRSGQLTLPDKKVGSITVAGVEYYECGRCGDRLLPPGTIDRIEAERHRLFQKAMNARPVGDFIFAAEAAEILGITRQALNKHRRIGRGFIYHIRLGGKTLYLRESVELFKGTGDGRFPLYKARQKSKNKRKVG